MAALLLAGVVGVACYSTGDGNPPPLEDFYYPVGLAVSRSGNVLYAVNSDFDLQWNGGTIQSFDLNGIRADAVALMTQTQGAPLPYYPGYSYVSSCPNTPTNPPETLEDGGRIPLTEACAPPMNAHYYWRDTVVVGAFATDLQLAKSPHDLGDRLFAPIRGDATLTWVDVLSDEPSKNDGGLIPSATDTSATYAPFALNCGTATGGRCDAEHHAGTLNDPGNTRQLTMPGEPFAMSFSDDLQSIVVTHQTTQQTSLFLSGMDQGFKVSPNGNDLANTDPSIQFILQGVNSGGIGIASVPHDPAAIPANQLPPRPSFLQTSNAVAYVDLLRYYSDTGFPGYASLDDGGLAVSDAGTLVYSYDSGATAAPDGGVIDEDASAVAIANTSSNLRPFLIKERVYPLVVNASGTNSRGITIDPSPRIACESALGPIAATDPQYMACAQLPANVYIANRSPQTVVIGQIGANSESGDGTYDPDLLTLYGNTPVSPGASNVYVAPIIDSTGHYSPRLFIVAFDSSVIYVYDPATSHLENIINVGPGPFAMAFDPFDPTDMATHALAKQDPRNAANLAAKRWTRQVDLKSYRFAYVASFNDSYMQVIDLDQSFSDPAVPAGSTFESVVYTVGLPTQPIGSSSSP